MIDFAAIPKDANGHPTRRYRVRLGSRSEAAFGVPFTQGVGIATGRALFQLRVLFGDSLVIETDLDAPAVVEPVILTLEEELAKVEGEGNGRIPFDTIHEELIALTGETLVRNRDDIRDAVKSAIEKGFPAIAAEFAKIADALDAKIAVETALPKLDPAAPSEPNATAELAPGVTTAEGEGTLVSPEDLAKSTVTIEPIAEAKPPVVAPETPKPKPAPKAKPKAT